MLCELCARPIPRAQLPTINADFLARNLKLQIGTQLKNQLPRLFVIRHGETEWSLSGQHTGRADIALTPNGQSEASQLGEQICHTSFQHVFMSPLQRARQTCHFAGLAAKALEEQDLIEWDNGDYQGRTHEEIEEARPGWNVFRHGCPNGESPGQISARADRLIEKLEKLEGNVALFTHGHFGRVLGVRWIELPIESAERFLLDTASISILSYQHNDPDKPAISVWNSTFREPATTRRRSRWSVARLASGTSKRRAIERWENEGGELLVPR
jgi:broad specificity phosphatase PhoE